MLRRILHQSNGHSLTNGHVSSHNHYNCIACTQGKLITRLFFSKSRFCLLVVLLTHLVDHFVILWFWLMHPLVGLMFAFFLLETLFLLIYLHKLSNSEHIFLIILLKLSVWIMPVNFLLKHFMTIACHGSST